jgi:hypothetical protein
MRASAASSIATADLLDPLAPVPNPLPPVPQAGDLPNLKLIFEDQFLIDCKEGEFLTKYGPKWTAYPVGWRDTSKKGHYNPGIISVTGGVMNMRLHTNSAGQPQVCAPEPKINGTTERNQRYGRYEVRMRADAVDGYKTAWLLWPKSERWPWDGEIDFLEGDLLGNIGAFMHRQNGTSGGDQDGYHSSAKYTDWHTVALDWLPNRCEFWVDGKSIGKSTNRIPNTPMRCVLPNRDRAEQHVPAKSAVANVQLDYIRVWR